MWFLSNHEAQNIDLKFVHVFKGKENYDDGFHVKKNRVAPDIDRLFQ